MENDLAVIEDAQMQTAAQVKAQVQRIQEVMKAVMLDGTHYGTVPGCGNKKILFKAGAEVLGATFRLAVDPQVEEIPTADGFTYRVKAVITDQRTGIFLGAGIGECSTNEEKYKWERTYIQKEFDAIPEDRRRIKFSSYDGKESEINQIRTNPADKANTVLKMAKKRALVDGVLWVTGASDIFTQDLDPEGDGDVEPKPNKTGTVKPKSEGDKDVRESLRITIAEICGGDATLYDEKVREFSGFGKEGDRKFIDGYKAIDNASEKWCDSTLGKARKALEELKKKANA